MRVWCQSPRLSRHPALRPRPDDPFCAQALAPAASAVRLCCLVLSSLAILTSGFLEYHPLSICSPHISEQASHKETEGSLCWRLDCGLCAAKNVTCNVSFTLPEMLAVARPLQAAINAEVKAGANSKGRVLDESAGNFNAKAIEALLDTRGYACTPADARDCHCGWARRQVASHVPSLSISAVTSASASAG